MWPFDRKKQPPATFSPEAIAKFRTYIPPPLPADYKPAKDLHIVPILPPPTKAQQHIRDELQAAVRKSQALRPRQKGTPEFPAFETELHAFGAHLKAAEEAMEKLEADGKSAEIEPGATLIYFLLALYCTRIAAFEQAGHCETRYSDDENGLLAGVMEPLQKDPMVAANTAQVAGVKLDLIQHGALLTAPPAEKEDAGSWLFLLLWDQCIHPDLQLPAGENSDDELPPPTAEHMQLRTQVQAVIRQMQTLVPTDRASEADFAATGEAFEEAAKMGRDFDKNNQPLEDGALIIFTLIALYNTRFIAYVESRGRFTPFTAEEKKYLDHPLGVFASDPFIVVNAADVAGVQFDVKAHDSILHVARDRRPEAAFKLFRELWRLCVHPQLELRES